MDTILNENNVLDGDFAGSVMVDDTLKKKGYAADAAEVGRKLDAFNKRMDEINPYKASELSYDNTKSGLDSENMQGAIDEVVEKLDGAKTEVENTLDEKIKEFDDSAGNFMKKTDKPAGTYTGNGSATERQILIGGTGGALLVWYGTSANNVFVVTKNGAVFLNSNANAGSSLINFNNGILTIKTSTAPVNTNETVYSYQVL